MHVWSIPIHCVFRGLFVFSIFHFSLQKRVPKLRRKDHELVFRNWAPPKRPKGPTPTQKGAPFRLWDEAVGPFSHAAANTR